MLRLFLILLAGANPQMSAHPYPNMECLSGGGGIIYGNMCVDDDIELHWGDCPNGRVSSYYNSGGGEFQLMSMARTSDAATYPIRIKGGDSWSQATGANRTGAVAEVIAGVGTNQVIIDDSTQCAGAKVTVRAFTHAPGSLVNTILTEGVDWNRGASNSEAATSLASAVDALSLVGASALSATAHITADDGTFGLDLIEDTPACTSLVEGTDGVVGLGGAVIKTETLGMQIVFDYFDDGDTYISGQSGDIITYVLGGNLTSRWQTNGDLDSLATNRPMIRFGTAAGGTSPNILPDRADTNTGIGQSADGKLTFIGDAKSVFEIDGTAIEGLGVEFDMPYGASESCRGYSQILDFDTGAASVTWTGALPIGAYRVAVTGRILEADTGACTSLDVGNSITADLYADDLDETSVGETFGSADWTATLNYNVDTSGAENVIAAAIGGNCVDLRIRIVVRYCVATGPTQ